MKKQLAVMLAVLIFIALHEGAHALAAAILGELKPFLVKSFGFEFRFRTPTDERAVIQWAVISGTSNVLTLLPGYSLLTLRQKCNRLQSSFMTASVFYLTSISLLNDAFTLSIRPFTFGGGVNGIAAGLGIHLNLIQAFFFLVMLANREFTAQKLPPIYHAQPKNSSFKPWVRFTCTRNKPALADVFFGCFRNKKEYL